MRNDPGAPRWVKTLAIVALAALVLVAVAALMGGGDHGPSRHGLLW